MALFLADHLLDRGVWGSWGTLTDTREIPVNACRGNFKHASVFLLQVACYLEGGVVFPQTSTLTKWKRSPLFPQDSLQHSLNEDLGALCVTLVLSFLRCRCSGVCTLRDQVQISKQICPISAPGSGSQVPEGLHTGALLAPACDSRNSWVHFICIYLSQD